MTGMKWIVAAALLLMPFQPRREAAEAPRPEYPKILTNADWQKKKGNIAKMAGETGVGAAMDEAKAAYDDVKWIKFSRESLRGKQYTPETIEQARQEARDEYQRAIEPLRAKVKKVRDLASGAAEKWKKSKTIPKSSRAHAEEVANAADQFFIVLKDNSSVIQDLYHNFDLMIEQYNKLSKDILENAMTRLDGAVKRAKTFISDVRQAKETERAKKFNDGLSKASRDVSQQVINISKFKTWKKSDPRSRPLIDKNLIEIADGGKGRAEKNSTPEAVNKLVEDFEKIIDEVDAWMKSDS